MASNRCQWVYKLFCLIEIQNIQIIKYLSKYSEQKKKSAKKMKQLLRNKFSLKLQNLKRLVLTVYVCMLLVPYAWRHFNFNYRPNPFEKWIQRPQLNSFCCRWVWVLGGNTLIHTKYVPNSTSGASSPRSTVLVTPPH